MMFHELILNIVTKHPNNCDLFAPNRIRQVYSLFTYDVYNHDVHFKTFQHNPSAKYKPSGGQYLQIMSGKDLYNQTIVVSSADTFHVRFPKIFVDYPSGSMRVGDKLWTNCNKAPLRFWQAQFHFAEFCTSSACEVNSEHLNYSKHSIGLFQVAAIAKWNRG